MLLRSSITTTKKFFQKTLKNFKSLFTSEDSYQRLPKTSPHNHLSYSLASMDNVDQKSENEEAIRKRRIKNKATILSSPKKQENEVVYNGRSYIKLSNANPCIEKREKGKEKEYSSFISMKERKYCMEEKLRELEMMDMSNVDYVLDIEEVLHYYSRLTCPAYVEIVDKFFMEMYSDLFGSTWLATPSTVNSRLNLRYQ